MRPGDRKYGQCRSVYAPMLPKVEDLRTVSATVAVEVAKTAMKEGVATEEPEDIIQAVQDAMWYPVYKPIRAI